MATRVSASKKKKPAAKKSAVKKSPAKKAAKPVAKKKAAAKKPAAEAVKKTATKKPIARAPQKPRVSAIQQPRSRQTQPLGQYPPGVYDVWLAASGEVRLARMLALGTTLPSVPGVLWKKNKEHWFTNAALPSLVNTLQTNNTIRVSYTSTLTNLDQVAAQLATPSLYVWQNIYAKEALSPSDWIAGAPNYGAPAFYYAQSGVAPEVTMRIVFEPSTTVPRQLNDITWLNVTNQLSTYFPGALPGTTVTLTGGGWPPVLSPSYYYRVP